MQGLIILGISFLITFVLSKTTNLKPVANYKNNFEYLPLLTSNLYADLLIIFVTYAGLLGTGKSWKVLTNWYKKYRLSAMIADILIGVLYLMAARYVDYTYNLKLDLFKFGVLAVAIQLFFDFAFYLLFSAIPKGKNDMLDMFKTWAKYAQLDALWGDSILVLVGVIVSAFLNQQSFNANMFWLIFGAYITPYIIYMKD